MPPTPTTDWATDWTPLLSPLAGAQGAQAFAALLAAGVCEQAGAHGVRVCLVSAEGPETGGTLTPLAEVGRGLTLCDAQLWRQAAAQGGRASDGMHGALLLGPLLLDVVGGDAAALDSLLTLAPLLGLAFEGVQAREARSGRGRESWAVTQLVRRMGGSLDLPRLLTATAQTVAEALGLERAFVGLFEAGPGQDGVLAPAPEAGPLRIRQVYTAGFDDEWRGGLGVGPESYARLFGAGEVIVYERAHDHASRLAAGLAELAPELALIAPLRARGRALGVLYADTRRPGHAAEAGDVWLMSTLAADAALSLDNARLYHEETRKRQRAEELREVGNRLARSLDLSETLRTVLERAATLFQADACAIYELQPDGRTLAIRSAVGLDSDHQLRARDRLEMGLVGRAVAGGEALAVLDVRNRPAGSSKYVRSQLGAGQYPFLGEVALPLSARGKTFGGLMLHYRSVLPLSGEDLAYAEVFAAQAALAVENARLYEEEVRRERESAVLLGVTQLLSGPPERAELSRAAGLITLALHAGRTLLVLSEGEAVLAWAADGFVAADGCAATDHADPPLRSVLALQHHLGRGPRQLSRRHVLPGAASGLIVPLLSGDTRVGYIYADHPGEEAPSPRVLAQARGLAQQVALALTRQRLHDALEQEEARYRQLAEGAHDLILTADAAGRVTYTNPASVRLLGQIAGGLLWPLVAPESTALAALWQAVLAGDGGGERCEATLYGLDGPLKLELRLSAMGGGSVLLVARDLSELQELAGEIDRRGALLDTASQQQSQLRSYLALFTQAQEEERRRISRELHDDTAQVLVATSRRVERLARELGGRQQQVAESIRSDLGDAIEGVRRYARNLRPSVLDDLGLLPALEWLASQAATPARLEVQGQERRLAGSTELTLFRLVQEALGNTDRHAGASSAAVRVVFGPDGVTVSVRDDGVGFTPAQAAAQAAAGHLGLTGLRERVQLAGGELELESLPGQGTEVRFRLPG